MGTRIAAFIVRVAAGALLAMSCGGKLAESSIADDASAVGGSASTYTWIAPSVLLTAGGLHTCAVVEGTPYCWGANLCGELGDDTTNRALVPVAAVGLKDVSAITAGGHHTCAVASGEAYCWGYNRNGQLGIGSSPGQSQVPVAISAIALPVTALSAGDDGTCAVTHGTIWCWGSGGLDETPFPVQVGSASGVTAVSTGSVHSCAISKGAAICWGKDADLALLGDGAGNESVTPVQVLGATSGVTAISAGDYFSCAVVLGRAWCWGSMRYGRLGGSVTNSAPEIVQGLPAGVTTIGVGEGHACALVKGGVWCWGYNENGQLGNASTGDSRIPVQVDGLSAGVSGLAVGGNHSCASIGSEIRCWGWNGYGQLGIGSQVDSTVPVTVSFR